MTQDASSTPRPPRRTQSDPPDSARSVGYTEAKTVRLATEKEPLTLESGAKIGPVDVEYEAYGQLSPARDNVILVLHALSGDAHVAGWDRRAQETGRTYRLKSAGWWDSIVGPGKPLDTHRYFVVCSNFLGSCYGTTGPGCVDPATGRRYALGFPVVSVADWVRLQARLLDALGIDTVEAVIGGSLGGQQAIEWSLAYPGRVRRAIVLAASARLSSQGVAFNAVGRQAILNDPNFRGGHYYDAQPPHHGLAVARMMAHITYLSEEGMARKFGRRRHNQKPNSGFESEFEVERYLEHQGRSFVERFDANSYLYISKAMDGYDAAEQWGGGDLVEACRRIESRTMVVSFSSDWLYPPAQCRELALSLCRAGKSVTYVDVPSAYGHDAFLVETKPVGDLVRSFLAS